MYTDSHCHLSFPELVTQLPDIRRKMHEANVTRALCICTTMEEFDNAGLMLEALCAEAREVLNSSS